MRVSFWGKWVTSEMRVSFISCASNRVIAPETGILILSVGGSHRCSVLYNAVEPTKNRECLSICSGQQSGIPVCFSVKFWFVKIMGNSLTASTCARKSNGIQSRVVGWMCSCLLLFVVPLAGCNRDSFMKFVGYDRASLLKKYTPQDDEDLARHYVELLRQSQFEQIEDHLDPSIKNAETRDTLTGMHNAIPIGDPISIKAVDASTTRGSEGSTICITLEYEFEPQAILLNGTEISGNWLIAQVVIQTKGGVKTVAGLHVSPTLKSFEEINEFTLADKGISQLVALFLAISVSGFTLYVFVLCIRTKIEKRKWIWLILITIGVFRFTANWTTGEWFFAPLSIQLPPVTGFCTPYGPWMIQITIPLGAIAFLLWGKNRTSGITASAIQSPVLADNQTGGT